MITQTNTAPGTGIPMLLRTTDTSSNVNVVANSQITVSTSGTYNIAFSAQVTKTDGGADTIYIWLDKDGVAVPDTNTGLVLSGSGAKQVAAWNFVTTLGAGHYVRVMWASADPAAELLAESDADTPYGPAIPSVILTVNQIG